ncbi:DUF6083 domain-containing protein [Streptomyces sp. SP18CS02]|uniref:DUF6083 domain-containing protein n=1 Tax=Streptomyces sp. SP18CS02 TaxID=3002531 RepID=UPI002E79861B|nr:DUF6083 domain-containing protein [Streptomyces sp. SP18CS02]MEE1751364.1 DUF6083 domain-containing protein [Streptomyces sp. SP18CS02]
MTAPVCAACEAPGAQWSAPLGMPLCAACTSAATGTPERDPVRLGDILPVTAASLRIPVPSPRTGSPMTCRHCGGAALWHRTVGGGWVAVEPGSRPAAAVPRGERWHIAGDGTAVNLRGAVPSDTCRVSHFFVCPRGRGGLAADAREGREGREGTGRAV